MPKNETWKREVIGGKEKMTLVTSVEVPDPVVEETLENKVAKLEAEVKVNKAEIEKLKKKS